MRCCSKCAGSLHLFGGVETLCRDLRAQWSALCRQTCTATAGGGAHAARRAGAGARGRGAADHRCRAAHQRGVGSALAQPALAGGRHSHRLARWVCAPSAKRCVCRAPASHAASGPSCSLRWIACWAGAADPRSAFRAARALSRAAATCTTRLPTQERILQVVQGPCSRSWKLSCASASAASAALELRLAHRNLPDTRCLLRLAVPQHLAQEFGALLQEQLRALSAAGSRCALASCVRGGCSNSAAGSGASVAAG